MANRDDEDNEDQEEAKKEKEDFVVLRRGDLKESREWGPGFGIESYAHLPHMVCNGFMLAVANIVIHYDDGPRPGYGVCLYPCSEPMVKMQDNMTEHEPRVGIMFIGEESFIEFCVQIAEAKESFKSMADMEAKFKDIVGGEEWPTNDQ